MQINNTEINGFTIDKFNQYDLPVGKSPTTCPKCSADRSPQNQKQKCFMVDWERGLGTCQHCGEVLQLHTFKRKGGPEKVYKRPEWKNNTQLSDKLVQWFENERGISQHTLEKMRVSEAREWMPQTGKEENTVQFNYFIGDELINIKYRDGRKNFKLYKDAEKVFYNINGITNADTAIIVEGELDALAFVEAGINNVVSVPNGANNGRINLDYLDNCYEYFEDKERVILCLDDDEPGQNLKAEFIRRLGAEVCFIANLQGCKDANEFLLAYGSDALNQVISEADPCPLENVVTLRDVNDELREFMVEGFKPGFQIGLEGFDDIFSTYTGQFCTVTGVPSSGKSDFVDRMAVGYWQNYGWKTAFASPENKPTFLHTHKLIRKVGDWMPTEEDIDTEKWQQVTEIVDENFYFIESEVYDLDSVLKKGAELVKRKGIKCLVIDPYNKVKMKGPGVSSMSTNDYTMEYLTKIDTFCKKYDVFVLLVAHPVKMNKGVDGEIEEPSMYNIKGGGEFYDASYHGLLVHRNYKTKTVKVKVLKVKFQNLGENQASAHFTWEPKSGNYVPAQDPSSGVGGDLAWL